MIRERLDDPDSDWPDDEDALRDLYSEAYLEDCAGEEARAERLAELARRIEQRAYRVDVEQIVTHLLERGFPVKVPAPDAPG